MRSEHKAEEDNLGQKKSTMSMHVSSHENEIRQLAGVVTHFSPATGKPRLFWEKKVKIPSGIQVQLNEDSLILKGPLGVVVCDLSRFDPGGLGFFRITDTEIELFVRQGRAQVQALAWGNSMLSFFRTHFEGISRGYLLTLECVGIGSRVTVLSSPSSAGQKLELKLGQSHDLFYELPSSLRAFSLKPSVFCLYGIEKQLLTQVAAELRQLSPPDPYKGKGIRQKDEVIRLREGKKK